MEDRTDVAAEDKIKLIWGLEEEKAVAYGCLPSPACKNWETKKRKTEMSKSVIQE